MTDKDVFENIHMLLSNKLLDQAFNQLYDSARDAIKQPYDIDINHAWYVAGDICYRTNDFHRAAVFFERSIQERPDDVQAYIVLGDVYDELGKPKDAERCFRRALDIEPDSQPALYNLGNALFDQGRYEDSVQIYETFWKTDSEIWAMARKNLKLAKAKLKGRSKP